MRESQDFRRMKIAVILGSIAPLEGGGFTFQDDLVDALLALAPQSQHHFSIVGNFPSKMENSSRQNAGNISYLQFGSSRFDRFGRIARTVLGENSYLARAVGIKTALDRFLMAKGTEMVWFATPFFRATELPYIYTVWDLQHRVQPWFPEVSSRGRWNYRDAYYGGAIRRAFRVIVANSTAQREADRAYGLDPDRALVLPHPTPGFAINHAKLPRPNVPTSVADLPDYFLYAAQFGPHKNHVGLLKALAILRDSVGRVANVVFVGHDLGNLEHVRKTAERLGLDRQVRFLGFVSRTDLVALYRNAIALVFPSFFGPENLPPLEAFALSCPVIAARVNGAQEQLGDAALLFDPADSVAMSEAMSLVMDSLSLRSTLIDRGIARASRWRASHYVTSVIKEFDKFAEIRCCWG
jgi:glycosyltransferase involved in cell wall biosynthesis